MRTLYGRLHVFMSAKLGRCPRCMQWSLRGAILGWAVLAAVGITIPEAAPFVAIWPASFSLLWVAHILTFGGRGLHALAGKDALAKQGMSAMQLTRRNVVWFARFASAAVVASAVLPRLASAQQAECPGGMHLCSDGRHCCPSGASYDCVVDTCNPGKSRRCYPATDENLKYLQQCCSQLVRC